MRSIQESGYTVRVGKDEAHQRWLVESDARLKAGTPAGTRYVGTYAVVFSPGKQSGGYRMILELDNYAAMDAAAATSKDPSGR